MKFFYRVEVADVTDRLRRGLTWPAGRRRALPEGPSSRAARSSCSRASELAERHRAGRRPGSWRTRRCGSRRTARGSASRPTTAPSRTSWAGSAPRCTCRRAATAARRRSPGCTTWASPPRRLVFLHLDGSEVHLPPHGTEPARDGRPGGRRVGFVTTSARHHELGPIALALVKRNVPVDARCWRRRRRRRRRSWSAGAGRRQRRAARTGSGPGADAGGSARGRRRSDLEEDGERAVVRQRHPHVRAERGPSPRGAQRRAAGRTTSSTSGSATGPGAAAFQVGRRPLRASP